MTVKLELMAFFAEWELRIQQEIAQIKIDARYVIDAEMTRLHIWVLAEIRILEDGAYAEVEQARIDIHNELVVTIQRLHTEASYEIAIMTQTIREETDATIFALTEGVRIEIHNITLELQARLRITI